MRNHITFVTAFLLLAAAAPLPTTPPAHADPATQCAQQDRRSGSCVITVTAPGSPGKPGRPAQPRTRTGTSTGGGSTGGGGSSGSEEDPHWPIEGCIRYDVLGTKCLIFKPSESSPDTAPEEGAPEPATLATVAIERMNLHAPGIGLWPEPLEEYPDGDTLVGWHNWMWLTNTTPNTRGPISRTVTQAGQSVTATAKVTTVTWEMGNGDTTECDKGTEYPVKTKQGRDEPSPTCGYVYHQRGDYTITATTHWSITWRGMGQQGSTTMDLSSQVHVHVIEMHVVNVPNGQHTIPSPTPSPNPTDTPTALAPCPTNHNKHGC